MSMRVTEIANGKSLEGLAWFAQLDTLPYSLDSPVWADAEYWSMHGRDDTPARESLRYSVRVEMLAAHDDTPARERLVMGPAGYGWITRPM